jgi:hypothetical protein
MSLHTSKMSRYRLHDWGSFFCYDNRFFLYFTMSASCPVHQEVSFPRCKVTEYQADHSPAPSADFQIVWYLAMLLGNEAISTLHWLSFYNAYHNVTVEIRIE